MTSKWIHLSILLLILCVCLGNLFLLPLLSADTHILSFDDKGGGGGVVVFYHIPRTGGTTIRENLKRAVSFYRVLQPRDLEEAERRINRVFQGSQEKLFIELHGTIPGLEQLHERVQQWRRQSEATKIPLFTFTLIRDPVSFSRSYFQHFHSPGCIWKWCERDTYSQDEEKNLLRTVIPNHQCKILLLGQRENKKRTPRGPDVTPEQCHTELLPLLEQDWDWVGTTETLQTITLPLLTRILWNDASVGARMIQKNASKRIHQSQLQQDTVDQILQLSSFDMELYNRVRREQWRRKPVLP